MGLLDEERARVDQEIGAEQVLDRVQDARVVRQLGRPGQDQIRHGPPFHLGDGVDRPTEPVLEPLKPVAAGPELLRIQERKRREEPVSPPSGDLLSAQDFHGRCPSARTPPLGRRATRIFPTAPWVETIIVSKWVAMAGQRNVHRKGTCMRRLLSHSRTTPISRSLSEAEGSSAAPARHPAREVLPPPRWRSRCKADLLEPVPHREWHLDSSHIVRMLMRRIAA